MKEIWSKIDGYINYAVSNKGRVKRLSGKAESGRIYKEKILSPTVQSSGRYFYVGLSRMTKVKYHLVHRLVAKAFIPNPSNKPTVNHIDSNCFNNFVDNLEWASQKDNLKHARDKGLIYSHPKGEPSPNRIFNKEQVINIREMHRDGLNYSEISRNLNISASTIQRMCTYKTYKEYP